MRLIDADAFKKYITDGIDGIILPKDQAEKAIAITKSFLKDIDEQPTVNRHQDIVIPVATIEVNEEKINKLVNEAIERARPHGEWIGDTDLDGTCKCSRCRMAFDIDRLKMVMCDGKYEMPNCCPNCGSDNRKKEGGADNEVQV